MIYEPLIMVIIINLFDLYAGFITDLILLVYSILMVVFMVRLKALVVVADVVEDYGDLLAIGRAEAKHMLRTHENVNVTPRARVFEVPELIMVVAKPLVVRGGSQRCG
jgi:hypothetical protein